MPKVGLMRLRQLVARSPEFEVAGDGLRETRYSIERASRREGGGLHPEIHVGKESSTLIASGEALSDVDLLFEIQKRRYPGE